MRNIKLTLEYEGTKYLGWQRQPQGMTVQQAVEEAIERMTGVMSRVTGAGRTDTGVHARGQVASFQTASDLEVERMRGALNALLPRDIAVIEAEEVPADFHARFSARAKRYEYTIWSSAIRPVLDRRFCWHVRWELDGGVMQEAADLLVGEHDFAAFQSAGAETETMVRTVTHARWAREGCRLRFGIEADGFLYNMVRAAVGTLVEVGRGKMSVARFGEVLASRRRDLAGRTAPPQGLCMMWVGY